MFIILLIIMLCIILLILEIMYDIVSILWNNKKFCRFIAKTTYEKCNKAYETAPRLFKELINNAPNNGLIEVTYGAVGTSKCRKENEDIKIEIFGDDIFCSIFAFDFKSPKNIMGGVLFHELGHAIDFTYGDSSVSGTIFKRALWYDENTVHAHNTGEKLIGDIGSTPIERFFFMVRNFNKIIMENDYVQDILDIVSHGKIPVICHHDEKYYQERPDGREKEIFANLMALYASHDYESLRRLVKVYGVYHLVDRFVSWINEMSREYGIEEDEKLNAILH